MPSINQSVLFRLARGKYVSVLYCKAVILAWIVFSTGKYDSLSDELNHWVKLESGLKPILFGCIKDEVLSGKYVDIQLACETVKVSLSKGESQAFLKQTIVVASKYGKLSFAQVLIIRFLYEYFGHSEDYQADCLALLNKVPQLSDSSSVEWWLHEEDLLRKKSWKYKIEVAKERFDGFKKWCAEQMDEAQRSYADSREKAGKSKQHRNFDRGGNGGASGDTSGSSAHSSQSVDIEWLKALAVLGLDEGATQKEVKVAYLRMAQVHHPDKYAALDDEAVEAATKAFTRIQNAYDYLRGQ